MVDDSKISIEEIYSLLGSNPSRITILTNVGLQTFPNEDLITVFDYPTNGSIGGSSLGQIKKNDFITSLSTLDLKSDYFQKSELEKILKELLAK